MKVSLNLAQYYSDKKLPHKSVDELVQKVGAQLGAVEEVIDFGKRYDGVVVAKIVSCEKHENADKLSVCQIDVGKSPLKSKFQNPDSGLVQVVCGAPNVKEGMYVVWIPPGATVPVTYDKDPFVLEARELRGVISNGMIASPSELAISEDHSGVLEIVSEDVGKKLMKPGTEFKKLYGLNDVILDIENKMFTHRPDCFGILGVTREIFGIYGQKFEDHDWYWKVPKMFNKNFETEDINRLKLEIKNELPELVPRFMAVTMDGIEVKPSPYWLSAFLMRVGVKPINNIVDLTNYYSYLTAQPLHAYDYDKVASLTDGEGTILSVRFPKKGEKVALLNGKIIEPRKEAIMIATDKELVGVGGVMGGTFTEVDENTKRIIIECANFDMYNIRKTSMEHGLFTDAVTRFNKGQSPLQNDRVIVKMMDDVKHLSGGNRASNVVDSLHIDQAMYGRQTVSPGITASVDFINSRLGMDLSKDEIMKTVRNVGFACLEEGKEGDIEFHAPFFRTDIELPEDIVEEIGRLQGFDKMPAELPKRTMSPAIIDKELVYKKKVRETLAKLGANEVLTYSFVHEKLIENADQDPKQAFKISNALSPDLQYYRMTLTPSLLNHVHQNIKAGSNAFTLFEINKTHIKVHKDDDNGVPQELKMVSMVVASKNDKRPGFYHARAYLDELAKELGIELTYEKIEQEFDYQVTKPFELSRSALVKIKENGEILGIIGEYKMSVVSKFKLPSACAGFEISLEELMKIADTKSSSYVPLSNYPSISQDICLEISNDLNFSEFNKAFKESLEKLAMDAGISTEHNLIDIFSNDKTKNKKRITLRIKFVDYNRTMQEKFVNQIMDKIAKLMLKETNAKRI